MQKFNFTQKGTWSQFIAKLNGMLNQKADKTEIPAVPTALPNPQAVTFSGILPEVSYDGSQAVNVALPTPEMMEESVGTPVGEIISFMGNTAPKNYLKCDGTVYNIADYPELAQHFVTEFGTSNHFGGDGETTFAVPDLQGEFLRGTGTNSHENSGDGANVGEHQEPTSHASLFVSETGGLVTSAKNNLSLYPVKNTDTQVPSISYVSFNKTGAAQTNYAQRDSYTSRPTNTSVLYCIKYKSEHFIQVGGVNYSLEERKIGTWIDGKPLYEKTFVVSDCTTNFTHNISDIDVGWVYTGFVDGANGLYFNSSPYWYFPPRGNVYALINLTKTQIQLAGGNFDVVMVGYFVVRYTKTTDSAVIS